MSSGANERIFALLSIWLLVQMIAYFFLLNSKRCTFEEFKPQSLEKHEHHTRKKKKVSGLSFVLKRRLRCKVYEVRLSLLHLPGKIIFFFLKTGDSIKVTRKM